MWLRDFGKVEEEVHTIIRCLRKLLVCKEFLFGVTGKSSILSFRWFECGRSTENVSDWSFEYGFWT